VPRGHKWRRSSTTLSSAETNRLYAREYDGGGPPIVLMHGFRITCTFMIASSPFSHHLGVSSYSIFWVGACQTNHPGMRTPLQIRKADLDAVINRFTTSSQPGGGSRIAQYLLQRDADCG
jgi:hypothetical protein